MDNVPAFLIFKDMKPVIDKLSVDEAGELFKALFEYVGNGDMPKLSRVVDTVFPIFQKVIDDNEKKYKAKCERNRANALKRYGCKDDESQTPPPEPPEKPPDDQPPKGGRKPAKPKAGSDGGKNQTRQFNLTREQAQFFASFQEHCKNKALDCQISEMPKVDYNALMIAIKQSQFLLLSDNLGLKWCLTNAEKIISGQYKNFSDKAKPNFSTARDYSKEEMNALFQDVNDIEI